jgi:ATP-dependent Lon protease
MKAPLSDLLWVAHGRKFGGAALLCGVNSRECSHPQVSHPRLASTGSLKAIMQELATIVYPIAELSMAKHFPESHFDKARLHCCCLEGAIRKDGPSAGTTMTTSLL